MVIAISTVAEEIWSFAGTIIPTNRIFTIGISVAKMRVFRAFIDVQTGIAYFFKPAGTVTTFTNFRNIVYTPYAFFGVFLLTRCLLTE